MIEKPTLDPNEWIFTLSDVKQLYISMRRTLFKWSLVGALLALICFGIKGPKYKAQASFKEGVEGTGGSGGALRELLGGIGGGQQPQAVSLMKSYQVLKPVVEKMGLQVGAPRSGWIVKKVLKRYSDNWKAERGLPLAELDPFLFQDVVYEKEQAFCFEIKFTDSDHFVVYAPDKKTELSRATLGQEIVLPEFSVRFTLTKAPSVFKIGSFYSFSIGSWVSVAAGLRDQFEIAHAKNSESIYEIKILNRDRHLSARLINELMSQYQKYLKREHDELAKEQLCYLENKQGQVYGKMESLFSEYTAYLGQNLRENGFISLEQESTSLLGTHEEMYQKVLLIDVELARLEQIEKEGKSLALVDESHFSKELGGIGLAIQNLKQQRDLLESSLSFSKNDSRVSYDAMEHSLQAKKDELKEIRNQRLAVEKLIQEVDLGGEISSFDLSQGLCLWASGLCNPEEREDLAEYLENYAHLLSVREKIIQERFIYGNNTSLELEGIDLPTALTLFVEYNNKLDQVEAILQHYALFAKQIQQPEFELISLSSIIRDPFCQKIIEHTGELSIHLKDDKHRSSKEAERWEKEMALQRKILADHLEQLYKVEQLNASLIRQKMVDLQKVSLDCINRQISVLNSQAIDSVKERHQALLEEKKILERKMGEIRALASPLPEKWRLEKWLELKTGMVTKMMESVTAGVESKSIANHLHRVESKPLDRALVPGSPENPHLRMKMLMGAVFFPFLSFLLAFIRKIMKGFPPSLEKFQALRLPVLGTVSSICDGPAVETPTGPDLDLLRRFSLFSEGAKVIGLLEGQGPDYSYALGENLARMSIKSVVLRTDFLSKFRKEDCPGLLQVWKGEISELPLRKGKGFDYMTSGGYTLFGMEILQSESFSQLIQLLKKKYDWVFLLSRAPLSSAESIAALRHCDKAVVTVTKEQTQELTPFVTWGYDKEDCRLKFIIRS